MEPEEGSGRDCWSVAFGNSHTDEERCIAAGYDNGDIKLFDLRTNTIRWEGNVNNGVSVECCASMRNPLHVVSCRDGARCS